MPVFCMGPEACEESLLCRRESVGALEPGRVAHSPGVHRSHGLGGGGAGELAISTVP